MHRIAVEVSDDSLLLLEAGEIRWNSQQGLASIVSTAFIDLLPSTAEAAANWASSRPTIAERLNAEVLTLKVRETVQSAHCIIHNLIWQAHSFRI